MGKLCAQDMGFNLHAARRIAAEDKEGRESLCRYILRPPVANQRLRLLPEGNVHLTFKRPWSDGTTSVSLEPLALISRLAAIVPPPKRHVVRYFGVLSSHSKLRRQIVPTIGEDVPVPVEEAAKPKADKRGRRSKYIPRRELLKRTFGVDIVCPGCQGELRLIALVRTEAVIKKILAAMGLPAEGPKAACARSPPEATGGGGEVDDTQISWSN